MAGLTIHPEIYIINDQQFDLAHGVTGGSGTELDPYVIQGWEMDASTTSTAGIDIRYTSVYFVIRDVYVHGVTDGIDFLYVVHGTIENTTTANNFNGITLSSSVADVIANNTVDGAALGVSVCNFNEGGRLSVVQGNIIRNLNPKRPIGTAPDDDAGIGIYVEADTAVTGNVIER